MERRPKTVFQLDSPFTTSTWPQVSSQDQETILELLCRLLSPIGQHRASHVPRSKGKRSKKRKRLESKLNVPGEKPTEDNAVSLTPPVPEISSFIALGLNTITRSLSASSSPKPKPPPPSSPPSNEEASSNAPPNNAPEETPTPPLLFSAIFVLRSSQPSILHAHLPQLILTSSLAHPSSPAPRLVQLPRGSDERICQALGVPRVSFVGLVEGAPHSKSLVDLIRKCVPEIEAPWLDEMGKEMYLPVKINAIETFVSVQKKK